MDYKTSRKRAAGLGTARAGVEHAWEMKVTSIALVILIPLFLFTFGRLLGAEHATVVAAFGNPFTAVVALLTIGVSFHHLKLGLQVVIEDYVHGAARMPALLANTFFCYALGAAGGLAVIMLAIGA
ncbi:MAG: succinate dehydrogenase, hydrophobic membrane anchor protein [Rubricella sp.]